MAKKDREKLRSTAEDLFISQNMSAKQIAELLDVSEQTLSKWRKGRAGEKSWDEKKTEFALTPTKIKEILLQEAYKVANGEASNINADTLSKITSAIDRLDKKVSVRMVIDVLKELDNYTAEINPVFAMEATKYHKLFIQHRIGLEG
jgi:transposase